MEQLNHKAGEALKGSWYANCRTDFDQNSFRSVDVDLKLPSFVHRRVEKSKQALVKGIESVMAQQAGTLFPLMWAVNLMRNIWTGVTDVSVHLPHNSNMFVTIK